MRSYTLWPLGAIALICVSWASGSAAAQGESLSGTANPDAENIRVSIDNQTVELSPRDDVRDYVNLQWACDNVAPGGLVELGKGTFFLGDGERGPRRTVIIRKGLRLKGDYDGGPWLAVIRAQAVQAAHMASRTGRDRHVRRGERPGIGVQVL